MQWPVASPYTLQLIPQVTDIDGLNHVNNGAYIRWCEQAAWQHSDALGLGLDDYQELDRAMAVRRSEYDYLKACYLSDRLTIGTWLAKGRGREGLIRRFEIRRQDDAKCVLRAEWQFACVTLSTGAPKRMPQIFKDVYLGNIQTDLSEKQPTASP